jgi:hypothetical protein
MYHARMRTLLFLVAVASAEEPYEVPKECVPQKSARLTLPAETDVEALVKWAGEVFCRPIVVPAAQLQRKITLELPSGEERAADLQRRVTAAVERAGLRLDTRGRIWKLGVPGPRATEPTRRSCDLYPANKKFLWDIRGPIDVGSLVIAYEGVTCRRPWFPPELAVHRLAQFVPRLLLTRSELEKLVRELLAANGLTLEDKRALVIAGTPAPEPPPPPPAAPLPPPPAAPVDPLLGDVDAGVTCAAVNQCTVERKLMERLLATSALANSARFVPSVKDDKPIGIKLYAIRPSSLFGKVGFQNGDTIEQVNGIDVRGFETLLEAYKSLRAATRITVKVQRRGQPVSLEVLVQ